MLALLPTLGRALPLQPVNNTAAAAWNESQARVELEGDMTNLVEACGGLQDSSLRKLYED